MSLKATMAHNPHLKTLEVDILYHFGLNTKEHDMKKIFGGVRVSIKLFTYFSYLGLIGLLNTLGPESL